MGKMWFSRVESSFYSFYVQLLPINLVSRSLTKSQTFSLNWPELGIAELGLKRGENNVIKS